MTKKFAIQYRFLPSGVNCVYYGLKEWCFTDKDAKNLDQVKKGGQGRDEILSSNGCLHYR